MSWGDAARSNCLSRMYGGARNEEAWNCCQTLYWSQNTDRWRQVHTEGMTLILDTDAGKHRVLKG